MNMSYVRLLGDVAYLEKHLIPAERTCNSPVSVSNYV